MMMPMQRIEWMWMCVQVTAAVWFTRLWQCSEHGASQADCQRRVDLFAPSAFTSAMSLWLRSGRASLQLRYVFTYTSQTLTTVMAANLSASTNAWLATGCSLSSPGHGARVHCSDSIRTLAIFNVVHSMCLLDPTMLTGRPQRRESQQLRADVEDVTCICRQPSVDRCRPIGGGAVAPQFAEFCNSTGVQQNCIHQQRYCQPDPDGRPGSGSTGRDALVEVLRSKCVSQVRSLNPPTPPLICPPPPPPPSVPLRAALLAPWRLCTSAMSLHFKTLSCCLLAWAPTPRPLGTARSCLGSNSSPRIGIFL